MPSGQRMWDRERKRGQGTEGNRDLRGQGRKEGRHRQLEDTLSQSLCVFVFPSRFVSVVSFPF